MSAWASSSSLADKLKKQNVPAPSTTEEDQKKSKDGAPAAKPKQQNADGLHDGAPAPTENHTSHQEDSRSTLSQPKRTMGKKKVDSEKQEGAGVPEAHAPVVTHSTEAVEEPHPVQHHSDPSPAAPEDPQPIVLLPHHIAALVNDEEFAFSGTFAAPQAPEPLVTPPQVDAPVEPVAAPPVAPPTVAFHHHFHHHHHHHAANLEPRMNSPTLPPPPRQSSPTSAVSQHHHTPPPPPPPGAPLHHHQHHVHHYNTHQHQPPMGPYNMPNGRGRGRGMGPPNPVHQYHAPHYPAHMGTVPYPNYESYPVYPFPPFPPPARNAGFQNSNIFPMQRGRQPYPFPPTQYAPPSFPPPEQ